MNKVFGQEAENLQITEHNFMLATAEEKLLKGGGAKKRTKQAW